jgi:hypothetical protein
MKSQLWSKLIKKYDGEFESYHALGAIPSSYIVEIVD